MAQPTYDPTRPGLLFVDPFSDFLSEGGKLWPRVKEVAEQVGLINNLKAIVRTVWERTIQVFIVPYHRWEPGGYRRWKHANPSQIKSGESQLWGKGTWGGAWHPDFGPQDGDVIVKEHWAQSGLANTDLGQQLTQHGIEEVILIGLVANTCIESTGRLAMELGHHVTLVTDATAAPFRRK
jgi:nicotinamidase-related amidase